MKNLTECRIWMEEFYPDRLNRNPLLQFELQNFYNCYTSKEKRINRKAHDIPNWVKTHCYGYWFSDNSIIDMFINFAKYINTI